MPVVSLPPHAWGTAVTRQARLHFQGRVSPDSRTLSGGLRGARHMVLGRGPRGPRDGDRWQSWLRPRWGKPLTALPCVWAGAGHRRACCACRVAPRTRSAAGPVPLWVWTPLPVTRDTTCVLVSCRANMEITSSKGHAFLTEPCCGVSIHAGRDIGGSGDLGPVGRPFAPHSAACEARTFRAGRARERAPRRKQHPGGTHLVLRIVLCVHTVNGEGAPSLSPLGVSS